MFAAVSAHAQDYVRRRTELARNDENNSCKQSWINIGVSTSY